MMLEKAKLLFPFYWACFGNLQVRFCVFVCLVFFTKKTKKNKKKLSKTNKF